MKFLLATLVILTPVHAVASSLITTDVGYDGPVLSLAGYGRDYFYSLGPIQLRGGITVTGQPEFVLGNGFWGLFQNGLVTIPIIGSPIPSGYYNLQFSQPVTKFAARMNYTLRPGEIIGFPPVITAFDSNDSIIGSFDLETVYPIRTPNGLNQFKFVGINGEGAGISRISFSGYGLILAPGNMSTISVPEPSSWAMLITGFGLLGAVMRRQRGAAKTTLILKV